MAITQQELDALQVKAKQLFDDTRWVYADKDLAALADLTKGAQNMAGKGRNVSYSNLVYKTVFHLPNVNGGAPYQIDVDNWNPAAGAIIGEFLSYMSYQSFINNPAILLSAVVVRMDARTPGPGFYDMARKIGLLEGTSKKSEQGFLGQEEDIAYGKSTPLDRVVPFP